MFKDRFDAGAQLAEKLVKFKNDPDTLVLAIPSGGVLVGYHVARQLSLPFDVVLSKKIGYPTNPDYTIGGVSLDNVIIDKRSIEISGMMENYLKAEIIRLRQDLREEERIYRQGLIPQIIQNKTIILVDDGILKGQSLKITIDLIKKVHPKKLIVALPCASKDAIRLIKKNVDEIICLLIPEMFINKSSCYTNLELVDHGQVLQMLKTFYV